MRSNKAGYQASKLAKSSRRKQLISNAVEPMESRLMMSATLTATGTGTDIENSGPYGTYLPVGSGGTVYNGFSSYGFVTVPTSGFGQTTPVLASGNGINSLSLSLYNSATSGKYAPSAGSFGIFVLPDNDTAQGGGNPVAASSLLFGGGASGHTKGGTQTDISALGTNFGTQDAASLGVTSMDFLGTFSVTGSLSLGYTTFTVSGFSAAAQNIIAGDINASIAGTATPLDLAIVSEDNTGHVDWDGNYNGADPTVALDVNTGNVGFSASTYNVVEGDETPANSTTATLTINNVNNASTTPTTVNYTLSSPTNATITTPTTGSVVFNPGDTSKTISVGFKDISSTSTAGSVVVTLTDPGSPTNATPVSFITGENTATVTDTYLQGSQIQFDAANYTVDEAAGTATFQVDRTFFGGATTGTASAVFSTADGVPYSSSATDAQDAENGRDYTTTSQTVTFTGTQTTATVTVPITDVKTFAGTRSFTASLTTPTNANLLGTETATETITDDAVTATGDLYTPMTQTSYTAGVENSGPYYENSYLSFDAIPHGSFNYATMPELEFPTPTGYLVGKVDSIEVSIDNTATSGGYGGTPGAFDLYALTTNDSTTVQGRGNTALEFAPGAGSSIGQIAGTQAFSPVLVGTAYFPNNQVGYNNFVFDNVPAAVSIAVENQQADGSSIRFVIVPHTPDGSVSADWEGNFSSGQPQLQLLVEQSATTPETINFDQPSYSVAETGGTATIQVDRTGTNLTDTETVNYTTSDASAVAGTNYNATSGTLTFAPGVTSQNITIPVTNLGAASQFGDKALRITLSSPAVTGSNTVAFLQGGATSLTSVLTITDKSTATTETLNPSLADAANVENSGPYDDTEIKATTLYSAYSSFGVVDFQAPVLSNTGDTITAIDNITFSAQISSVQSPAAGNIDFYLVSNNTASIAPGGGTPTYSSSNGVEGLGSQLGTTYLLGKYDLTDTKAGDTVTVPLIDYTAASETALINFLNSTGNNVRLVVTPEDTSVEADFVSSSATLSVKVQQAPAVTSSLPGWLAPGSIASFNKTSETLDVTGAATIIADPAGTTFGDGSVAITVEGTGSLAVTPSTGTAVHIGSLNLLAGSLTTVTTTTAAPTVLLIAPGTGALAIATTGKLDLTNNFLDVEAGNFASVTTLVTAGSNGGKWNGNGLTSSTAASDSRQLTALGETVNSVGGNSLSTLYTTFGGAATSGSSDVLVRFTYYGDTYLDGHVDGSDYSNIDSAFAAHSIANWSNGDFNYDGAIDGSDYTLIDNTFNMQGSALAKPQAELASPATMIAAPAAYVPAVKPIASSSVFSTKKLPASLISQLEEILSGN